MVNIPENAEWVDGIYQLETRDPVVGGPPNLELGQGFDNVQAQQLAQRTQLLLKVLTQAFLAVTLITNEAPAQPASGSIYLSGSEPVGNWADANKITIWGGSSWMHFDPNPGQVFVLPDGTQWFWDGVSGEIRAFGASDFAAGPVRLASLIDVLRGINATDAVTPATLAAALGKGLDGQLPYIELNNDGQTSQSIANDVAARCDNMIVTEGNISDLWDGQRFTVDANHLGFYGVLNRLNTNGESGEGAQTWKNGSKIRDYQLNHNAGTHNVFPFFHMVPMLVPGDYIEFFHLHKSSSAKTNRGSEAQIYRLTPYTPLPV